MEFLVLFFRLSLMSYIRDIMLEEGYYIAQDVILLIYALPPETCHLWFTTRDSHWSKLKKIFKTLIRVDFLK